MVHAWFQDIELLVPKKKIVKVLAIYMYGHGGHLGHMTETIFINSCSSFLRI